MPIPLYGFMTGDTSQWFPDLVSDNTPVPPPATPEEGYHLNRDLADHAIQFIKDAHVALPDKPFLLYYATGAGHAPQSDAADEILDLVRRTADRARSGRGRPAGVTGNVS